MNIYVTGSEGFIGKHLTQHLQADGHTVNADGCDVLIHLAAKTHLRCDFDGDLIESNIIYAKEMLTTPHRTLFASSTSAAELSNPYAYTKRYGEWLCSKHPNALALRLFNVYGPGCKRGIVQRAIHCAFTGEVMELQTSGHLRDYIYIDDVCDIFVKYLSEGAGIVDVGTGRFTPPEAIISSVEDITGKNIAIKYIAAHPGQQEFSCAEFSDCNYIPLHAGLEKTIEAYKKENGI